MTVKELIKILEQVEDKNIDIFTEKNTVFERPYNGEITKKTFHYLKGNSCIKKKAYLLEIK